MELLTLFKSLHEEHPIEIVEESEIPEGFQEISLESLKKMQKELGE